MNKYIAITSALLAAAGAVNSQAIGDIQISLQGTNVVLSWGDIH